MGQAHNQTTMAAVSVRLASKPNAATARAKRKACRRRSRSSCTSTVNSSSRFSPMVNNRCAKCFEVVASCLKLTVDSSITKSIAVAGAPARDEIADEHADTESDANGLIKMFKQGFLGRLLAAGWPVTTTCR